MQSPDRNLLTKEDLQQKSHTMARADFTATLESFREAGSKFLPDLWEFFCLHGPYMPEAFPKHTQAAACPHPSDISDISSVTSSSSTKKRKKDDEAVSKHNFHSK